MGAVGGQEYNSLHTARVNVITNEDTQSLRLVVPSLLLIEDFRTQSYPECLILDNVGIALVRLLSSSSRC